MTTDKEFQAMTPAQHKTFENRLRRMARRQGFILVRSGRRDPHALDYGRYALDGFTDEGRTRFEYLGHDPNGLPSMAWNQIEHILLHPDSEELPEPSGLVR